jgi:glycosyltransferase-like protein
MTRVGMFTYSTQPRGSVVHAACLSEALTRRGHDVTLFALSKSGSRFWRELACRVCLIPAAEAPAEMDALIAQRIAELARGLAALSPALDLLHAQDCLVASALLEARRSQPALFGSPLLRTVHHVERFESPYLAECQRRSVQEADVVLSVSRMTAEDVLSTFERPSARVDNGVDLARFDPTLRVSRAALLAELGLPSDAFVVLSVGGVEPRKNSRRCLAAIASAGAESDALSWVIAGGASVLDHQSYRAEFEADLAALPAELQRRVVRTGSVEERRLTELYLASDVLLGASEHEGFGLSVLEGMAAGLPVIVPRRPPFTEYVPEHVALFVEPESTADIARALLALEREPALRSRLGELGPSVAREFSWERSAEQHARVYERALLDVATRPRRFRDDEHEH